MIYLTKILIRIYLYLKKIYKKIKKNIFNTNIENKYNLIKINNDNLKNKECIFCLELLIDNKINYQCQYCSISFHDKCFKNYIEYSKKIKCLQCNR